MRVALSGASGFVGAAILRALLGRGHQVIALVRDPARFTPPAGVEVRRFDLDQAGRETPPLAGADCLCHAAAFIPPNLADPSHAGTLMRINALGTLHLVQAARAAGVPRFLFLSTGNTYVPGLAPVDEVAAQFPCARAPYYLASKLAADVFVAHEGLRGGIATCTLRLGSVYGPLQPAGQIIPRFIQRLRSGEGIVLNDEGIFGSDFVHVDDVAMAVLAAIERPGEGAYNIGSGVRTNLREVCDLITTRLNCREELISVLPPLPIRDFGFAPLDISRARRELSYRPRNLAEGIEPLLAAAS